LGSGEFGVVHKGVIRKPDGEMQKVAIKSVKTNVHVDYYKAFLLEIKILAYLEKHENIACLVGACTNNIQNRELTKICI
jgi:Protein tyrosine and serine/threonine kinase